MPGVMFYLPSDLEQKVMQESNRAKLVQTLLREYYESHKPGEFDPKTVR